MQSLHGIEAGTRHAAHPDPAGQTQFAGQARGACSGRCFGPCERCRPRERQSLPSTHEASWRLTVAFGAPGESERGLSCSLMAATKRAGRRLGSGLCRRHERTHRVLYTWSHAIANVQKPMDGMDRGLRLHAGRPRANGFSMFGSLPFHALGHDGGVREQGGFAVNHEGEAGAQ